MVTLFFTDEKQHCMYNYQYKFELHGQTATIHVQLSFKDYEGLFKLAVKVNFGNKI